MDNPIRDDATLKLLVFYGTRKDDVEQHWFACEVIQEVKQTLDDHDKITRLETIFRERALTWYMKFKDTTPVGKVRTLDKIRHDLLKEFQKPKFESQCITEIKEINKKVGYSIWDYDQRFKIILDKLTFQIPDTKHREGFIKGLLSHTKIPLTQQKLTTQYEALEIAM